jgi:hypothetical protein
MLLNTHKKNKEKDNSPVADPMNIFTLVNQSDVVISLAVATSGHFIVLVKKLV